MNLKKKIKGFFTLTRKSDGGFTLVELIVVIAILAILAGVAVPAYSGYVSQANKQADMTLASDVKNAMMLAYYEGTLEDGASVVVYYGDGKTVNTDPDGDGKDLGAAAAMTAAFGESYTGLTLKWDGWKNEVGIVADSTMLGHVDNSGFNEGNLGNLLTSVQYLVDNLAGYVDGGSISISDPAWKAYMEENGISTTDGRTAANATTMFVADTVSGYASSDEKKAEFWKKWYTINFTFDSTETIFSTSACEYAHAMALATYVDEQTRLDSDASNDTNYVTMLQASSGTQIIQNISTVLGAIGEDWYDQWCGATAEGPSTSSRAYSDCMAFLAYMGGLDNSADSLMADTNLSAENYYGDGSIQNYINSYISTGRAMGDCPDGAMAFTFSNGQVLCNPLDY